MKIIFTILLVLIISILTVHGYTKGDLVNMKKKSLMEGRYTEWSEVAPKHAPRFALERSARLPAIKTDDLSKDTAFKMLFSFENNRFTTSWITIADGSGKLLNLIEFVFVYSGNDIVEVKWHLDYTDVKTKVPEQITVKYSWVQFIEQDTSFALSALFVSGFILSSWMIAFTLLDSKLFSETPPYEVQKDPNENSTNNPAYNSKPNENENSPFQKRSSLLSESFDDTNNNVNNTQQTDFPATTSTKSFVTTNSKKD